MSAVPSKQFESEEDIARNYVDGVPSRCGGSFVFLDYNGRIYPGVAKLLEIKDRPDLSIVRLDKIYPPASDYIVELVLRKRPGVVKLGVDGAIGQERRFYAKLKYNKLEKLTREENDIAWSTDAI
ncbi:hypothetical protein J4423_00215 [Candidatus Pacearchaeota archaeon]|nr:hypothetical protein [Candidatus Pacearchaeota archaeon]